MSTAFASAPSMTGISTNSQYISERIGISLPENILKGIPFQKEAGFGANIAGESQSSGKTIN